MKLSLLVPVALLCSGLVMAIACSSGPAGAPSCDGVCKGVFDCGSTPCIEYCVALETACTDTGQDSLFSSWASCGPTLACDVDSFVSTTCTAERTELLACGSVSVGGSGTGTSSMATASVETSSMFGSTSSSTFALTSTSTSTSTFGSTSSTFGSSSHTSSASGPTWSYLYDTYLSSLTTTIGDCDGSCHHHSECSSAAACYAWIGTGVYGKLSNGGDLFSWDSGYMPTNGPASDPQAEADFAAWIAAGSMDD